MPAIRLEFDSGVVDLALNPTDQDSTSNKEPPKVILTELLAKGTRTPLNARYFALA
jgi:hypothetical protein